MPVNVRGGESEPLSEPMKWRKAREYRAEERSIERYIAISVQDEREQARGEVKSNEVSEANPEKAYAVRLVGKLSSKAKRCSVIKSVGL